MEDKIKDFYGKVDTKLLNFEDKYDALEKKIYDLESSRNYISRFEDKIKDLHERIDDKI